MSCTRQIAMLSSCAVFLALQGCGKASPDNSSANDTGGSLDISDQQLPNGSSDDGLPTADATAGASVDLNPGPEGDSRVSFDAQSYPLDSALGDIWGVRDDHYQVTFTLTNGKFNVTPTEVDGVTHNLLVPVIATAVFYAELHSPGDSFAYTTYSHSPFGAGGGVLAGNAFFENAYVEIDLNNSGGIEPDERMLVRGGTVEFTGSLPHIELRFNVTVDNGQSVEGHYTGLFDFTDRS